MRKLREVLRLRFELNLGYQQIGRSCSIGVSTVHKYRKRAEAAGITWECVASMDEANRSGRRTVQVSIGRRPEAH